MNIQAILIVINHILTKVQAGNFKIESVSGDNEFKLEFTYNGVPYLFDSRTRSVYQYTFSGLGLSTNYSTQELAHQLGYK